jgi:hypothetical protein
MQGSVGAVQISWRFSKKEYCLDVELHRDYQRTGSLKLRSKNSRQFGKLYRFRKRKLRGLFYPKFASGSLRKPCRQFWGSPRRAATILRLEKKEFFCSRSIMP